MLMLMTMTMEMRQRRYEGLALEMMRKCFQNRAFEKATTEKLFQYWERWKSKYRRPTMIMANQQHQQHQHQTAKLNNHMQPREEYWWLMVFPKAPFACIPYYTYACLSLFALPLWLACAHTNIYIHPYPYTRLLYKCWEQKKREQIFIFIFVIPLRKATIQSILCIYSRTNRISRLRKISISFFGPVHLSPHAHTHTHSLSRWCWTERMRDIL